MKKRDKKQQAKIEKNGVKRAQQTKARKLKMVAAKNKILAAKFAEKNAGEEQA